MPRDLHLLSRRAKVEHGPAGVGVHLLRDIALAKLLCRLYDPQSGAIEVDGVDLRQIDVTDWRSRITAVFQDFIRFELPLRDNVAPSGAPDDAIAAALTEAGASQLATLDTILAKGYQGGTDLSGGQWQRVALARALCAVRQSAGLVLLDEPTAQLDVRGEAEIFRRVLAATRTPTRYTSWAADAAWNETGLPGIRARVLAIDHARSLVTLVVSDEHGAAYPPKTHHGKEDCYVISG